MKRVLGWMLVLLLAPVSFEPIASLLAGLV